MIGRTMPGMPVREEIVTKCKVRNEAPLQPTSSGSLDQNGA